MEVIAEYKTISCIQKVVKRRSGRIKTEKKILRQDKAIMPLRRDVLLKGKEPKKKVSGEKGE